MLKYYHYKITNGSFMIIQGSINTDRDNLLIKKYSDLIKQGINTGEILVLLLNPYKKTVFIKNLLKEFPELESDKLKIYTIFGLCYNCFKDNEEYIKDILKCNSNDILNQCGLEVSQYIFKQCIKEADFSDYISKVNLLHQLFRRYSLTVQNDLTNNDLLVRSQILNETFYKDAQKAINNYKLKTIEYKSFDYLRQLAIFPLIYKNTDYFTNIKYLIVNDADELSYAIWQFIYHIIPFLNDYLIAYDKDGSTRCGYLCAYKSGIKDLKEKFAPKELILKDKSTFSQLAEFFSSNIRNGEKTKINDVEFSGSIRRLDMIDNVLSDIKKLISSGIKENEISIITPITDEVLEQTLNEKNNNIKFQIISGSSKLSDVTIIKYILSILKIINNIKTNDYEIKNLLIGLLKFPFRKCFHLITYYKNNNKLPSELSAEDIRNIYNEKYLKLINIIKSLQQKEYTITEQIKIIFENLIKEVTPEEDMQKYNFLLKEAQSFENAFKDNLKDLACEFIIQIENSVISENPANSFSLKNNAVIVSSPQKLIDYNIKTKYMFLIDISNGEWFKQDTGTLYNAWVLNRDWSNNEYTLEDNIKLTRDKTARIIRKLILSVQKEIKLYSSFYDNSGNENFGGLTDYIELPKEKKPVFNIIPRDDQKPVLEYSKGKMGIMAVPGAGKTTILLALIIKLIKSGINPNNIFVLTYMESAAKNFKERIKAALPDTLELPNISTIHGLALRIIKENGNYIKTGLDENFEICDDSTKEKIVKELFFKLKLPEDKYENYMRCISIVKLSLHNLNLKSKYPDILEFFNFLNEYNTVLKQQNLIDYDDMLRFAVEILEQNPEIAQYYQNICQYIIEDEAQDSSEIQQTLINILAAKHNNIVRCGDINQSITSTFTNSNLKSFKTFINKNTKVEMVSSQRCAKQIYTLANRLIELTQTDEFNKDAFYPIKIQGTKNNPVSDSEPQFISFENESEEKQFILNKVKEIQKNNENASIAILLRLNSRVNDYNCYFNENGIKTSIRSDSLSQKGIYKYIYAVLCTINNPLNNNNICNLADLYKTNYNNNTAQAAYMYLKDLKTPFIEINPDSFNNELLIQLYWDIDYWLNNANKPIDEITLRIGLYYSKNTVDKSNTYLISTFIKRLKSNSDNIEEILKQLEYIAQKPLSAYHFFEDESECEKNAINIMTMHKSKGDEFDFVFIPELNEENYSISKEKIKLKSGSHFVQTIKNTMQNCGIKTPEEQKKELSEETLRLLYVGITRAKKGLYLTNALNYKIRKKTFTCELLKNLI